MKIGFIYDRNKMDSVFAAAALLSHSTAAKEFVMHERSGLIDPECDVYYWLGVFPSRLNFYNWRKAESKKHLVFTDTATTVYSRHHELKGVQWYGSKDVVHGDEESSRGYRRASLLEMVFENLGLKHGPYSLAIEQQTMFYSRKAPVEFLVCAFIGMKTALEHLEKNKPGWVAVSRAGESDWQNFNLAIERTRVNLDKGSRSEWLYDTKKEGWTLFTTYMNEDFWIAKRFLELRNAKYRNVSYNATGMNVITNAIYSEGLTKPEPNFVF